MVGRQGRLCHIKGHYRENLDIIERFSTLKNVRSIYLFIDQMPKILTKKERSKKWELSNYDIRSLIVQVCIVLVPYILANINDISILLEQWI